MDRKTNRLAALALVLALILSLAGCASSSSPADAAQTETQAAPAATQPQTEAAETPTTEQTQPEILEGSLFLKVSSITFTLAGESEDIYLGVIPRELVTWESENPHIISVENGVLTAVSPGTTVIHASYYDRQVSCTAGCLAQTQEDLQTLDPELLTAPKWLPPQVDLTEPCAWFDNAAIVGDSITYGMMQYESGSNALGNMLFMARGGVSIMGFVKHVKNIVFRGQEMNLEDAIALSGVERVYFLMGSNDIGVPYEMDVMMENWGIIVDLIREKCPDMEIVLISSLPRYVDRPNPLKPDAYNQLTMDYNTNLRQFAGEHDCMYLDLHSYIQDHRGNLSVTYKIDDTHLNELGCATWMGIMRYFAQYESEGGILE